MTAAAPQPLQSLYEVLGVSADATPEQIRHAYHEKALLTHPDLRRGSAAEIRKANAEFARLSEAYATLMDQHLRAAYDGTLHSATRRYYPPTPPPPSATSNSRTQAPEDDIDDLKRKIWHEPYREFLRNTTTAAVFLILTVAIITMIFTGRGLDPSSWRGMRVALEMLLVAVIGGTVAAAQIFLRIRRIIAAFHGSPFRKRGFRGSDSPQTAAPNAQDGDMSGESSKFEHLTLYILGSVMVAVGVTGVALIGYRWRTHFGSWEVCCVVLIVVLCAFNEWYKDGHKKHSPTRNSARRRSGGILQRREDSLKNWTYASGVLIPAFGAWVIYQDWSVGDQSRWIRASAIVGLSLVLWIFLFSDWQRTRRR